jgi:hypothetical protein
VNARGAALLALVSAACGDVVADPCEGIDGACLIVRVDSDEVDRIDRLELDLLYGFRRATTSTQAEGGEAVSLPAETAIELDLADLEQADAASIDVDVVAGGSLDGMVQGIAAGSATLRRDERASLDLVLAPGPSCTASEHLCGDDILPGEADTLYECVPDGVPRVRGRCSAGCIVVREGDDVCRADGGVCVEGGFYCGGDKLDGDPRTLYTCREGRGVDGSECPDGCQVRPGRDDVCRAAP